MVLVSFLDRGKEDVFKNLGYVLLVCFTGCLVLLREYGLDDKATNFVLTLSLTANSSTTTAA